MSLPRRNEAPKWLGSPLAVPRLVAGPENDSPRTFYWEEGPFCNGAAGEDVAWGAFARLSERGGCLPFPKRQDSGLGLGRI